MRSRNCQDVVLLVGLILVSRSMLAAEPPPYRFDAIALRGARIPQENATLEVEPRSPQADDPDLLVWLDAADRTTLTVDEQGAISAWKSKALATPCVVSSTGTQRPQLVENAWDGKPAVRFDGQDDVLRNTQFNQSVRQWTLFLVACPRSNKGSGVPDGFHGFFSANRKGQPDFVTGVNVDMGGRPTDRFTCLNVESNKGGGETNLLFVSTDFGRPRVLAVRSDQEQTTLFAEAVGQATRPANDTATALEEVRIGARSYMEGRETGFVDADIAELVLYARALPVDHIQAISRYVQQKYAVVSLATAEHVYSLDEAITILASYEWDQSRAPLVPIDDVVRQGSVAERTALEEKLSQTLRQGVSPAAVDFIGRRLAIIGTAVSVPSLQSLLSDPERGAAARQALEQIPAPEAGQALLASLANADLPTYIALVHSLGVRREIAAVELLLETFHSDQPAKIEAAAHALAEIGDPRATGDLLNSPAVSPHTLLTLAASLAVAGHTPESLRVYAQLEQSNDGVVRAAVLCGLITMDPSRAVERLLQALRGDDDRLRGQAAQLLAQPCSKQVLSAVWAEFPGLPVASQELLLGMRWSREPKRGRELALRAVQGELPEIRADGLRVLADVGDASDVELIARVATGDSSPPVRKAAELAMRHVAGVGTNAALIRLLSAAPTGQHVVLIRAVRDRHARGAESALLQWAASSDAATRLEALGALEQLGDATIVPSLVARLLIASTAEEQTATERAIWRCALRNTGTADSAEPLIAAYQRGQATDRALLLPVLGRIGGPSAAEIIRAVRTDAQPTLRAAAIRGLANWPDATVADELIQLARQSEESQHRIWALRGYIRVVTIPNSRPAEQTLSMLQDAWKVSTRDEERRLILQRLPAVVCVGSLEMVISHLRAPALRDEAVASAAQLAESLLASNPVAARQAIETILALDVDPALRVRLRRHLPTGQ